MLQLLRVRNFALIDDLALELDRGFNLLSGETGAGKSLIVDALGLIGGAKASGDVIRTGERRAVIEAVFEHPDGLDMDAFGIDADDDLVIRREIASDNRNRVFVNNQPCTVSVLRTIASSVLDIHGQHQHQTLLDGPQQLTLVDRAAGTEALRSRVSQLHKEIRALEKELESLHRQESEILQRADFLRFQRDEIERVAPLQGETERLRGEVRILEHSGKLLEAAAGGYESLYESDASILSTLAGVESAIRDARSHDPRLEGILEQLASARVSLEDVAYSLRDYLRDLDADPGQIEHVQTRLADLERLHRKYGPDLLGHLTTVTEELDRLGLRESRKSTVIDELTRLRSAYTESAEDLSRRRRDAAGRLERDVTAEVRSLAMPEAAFSMEWTLTGESRASGIDLVRFLLAPNPGEPGGPLSDLASGGELSRTMLALRTVLATEGGNRTLVFDEVDAGIGGAAAEQVGQRLRNLSRSYQVLCVTHLSQIARFADHHARIEKRVHEGRTLTRIEVLDADARIEELARMMSGKVTDAARRHVQELLEKLS